ncbi:gliding motility protein RemB [Flavobacterium tibetense]|uniref:Gliding motility protein RemB n=1 Tax=Flavobacterium tibetense TaxID=2233533 RepID=A0A365NZW7_9FLAO|nr:gliding motility protein RemB [Flavobacterium tibetense]RBA27742.1 gliding motility protein RemB [Flavobacterium tibetense]
MRNYIVVLSLVLGINWATAQVQSTEQMPQFPECENEVRENQEACFYNTIQTFFFQNFKVPQEIVSSNYKGNIYAVFEVDTIGKFKTLYIDAVSSSLKEETQRVFDALPKVKPATYSGRPTFAKYTIKIGIPLEEPTLFGTKSNVIVQDKTNSVLIDNKKELTEFEDVAKNYKPFENLQYKSNLNVAFTHLNYANFDALLNQVGSNNHTATKPYSYAEVAKYYDFEAVNQQLMKQKDGWWGRKIFNENLIAIQGEKYWFTMNPIFDFRGGKDLDSEISNTFVNTRGVQIQGALGEKLTFTTSIYESQGRFADYYNAYSETLAPSGGNPAIIPGIGIAKRFKDDAYDFPMAEANLKYKPNEFIDLQLGYGRNFIGDGYRSLLQSDATSPYPFFKINTSFWKIKYTNTYMWLKDVRPEVTVDGAYASKYMASHYLSYNLTKRLNIGLFESVVWSNTNDRGFDVNFVNPIIFYRAVEFSSSSRAGNAVLGATAKYKWNNQINFYSQFLLDEFAIGDVREQNQSWRNKFGYQIGAKYYDAFQIKNLTLQVEYNQVRPYVYSHSNPLTNYAHNNISMGHQWGANFRELVGIARYQKGRYYGEARLIYGQRGFDFNDGTDNFNYGGNIYLDYDENRPFDTGVGIAQGNKTNVMIADLQLGYLVNPVTNMRLFGNFMYRNFDPTAQTASTVQSTTTWISIGLRSDLFNWYFDY